MLELELRLMPKPLGHSTWVKVLTAFLASEFSEIGPWLPVPKLVLYVSRQQPYHYTNRHIKMHITNSISALVNFIEQTSQCDYLPRSTVLCSTARFRKTKLFWTVSKRWRDKTHFWHLIMVKMVNLRAYGTWSSYTKRRENAIRFNKVDKWVGMW